MDGRKEAMKYRTEEEMEEEREGGNAVLMLWPVRRPIVYFTLVQQLTQGVVGTEETVYLEQERLH